MSAARIALAAGLLVAGCGGNAAPSSGAEPPTAVRPEPPPPEAGGRCSAGVDELPVGVHRGMSVAHTYGQGGVHGYGTQTSRSTLRELDAVGVDWVSLTPFGYLRSLSANEVQMITDRAFAENDERMRREIEAAHALGMKVLLKPHVWVAGGAWRGRVAPSGGWPTFFRSYERFILHYAEMAEQLDVELLVVATELPANDAELAGHWRRVIARVRGVYDGPLTYAANWDVVEEVAFWDALDFVGVQFYPPLAQGPDSTEADCAAALRAHLDRLGALHERVGRPVLLTEVGYKSIVGTEVAPHQWPERHGAPRVSQPAQARAYRRLLRAVAERDFVQGLYFWKWFTDPRTSEEGADGFSPRGKQAEEVLRAAFGGACP